MTICKLPFSVGVLIVGMSAFCNVGHAQDISVIGFVKVYKADGHYEYNKDGVPVLGLVTARLNNDRVKFTMCNNATVEVAFRELTSSAAKCPGKMKDPGPWTTASKTIIPLIKAQSGPTTMMVKFEGMNIDLSGLPVSYKDTILKAKTGDWVGFAFTGEDGKKSLGILTMPIK